ncbi:hypothetical protein QUB27_30240, partial [Microcoleus sp. AT8-B6]|uniref:hypothetical protein n=1 Tax=Microcoleus sp. AT8-B6 TaxID=2818622 RepID=UPI002FD2C069
MEASQTGNANFNAATPVQQSFTVVNNTVVRQNQTISFGTLPYRTFTSPPFELAATSTSGLPVSYRVVSGPVTIVGNLVTITGIGSVSIEASQSGNDQFNAATPVVRSFTVGRASQTLTFPTPTAKVFGDAPFALAATASSGLAVAYRVVSGPATVSGNMVTLTGIGTVSIEASQPGNINFSPAASLVRSFTVTSPVVVKQNQSITFPAIAARTFGEAPFALTATATSGLSISYRIVSGPATVSGNTITLTGTGLVTVEANQDGNGQFNAAPPATQSFAVAKAVQTISFAALANRVFGDAPFAISASASSALPVTFSIISGPAAISGNTITLTGAGTVTIRAAQDGNANYEAAQPVTQSFTVAKASQVITFAPVSGKVFGEAPFALNASATSGLAVSFRVVSGPATINGAIVTLTGTGTVMIEALQAGNDNYQPAPAVTQSIAVAAAPKLNQSITFGTLANRTFGEAPFTISASASSGLAVSFRIVSGPATISGSQVTLTGAGTVVVEASQTGNTNFNAATPVQQSFTVAKASQAITFNALPNRTLGEAPFTVTATATSGLSVSFRVVSGPATIAGNVVTLSGLGEVVIEAAQGGNTNFNAALPVSRSFLVQAAPRQSQTITFPAMAARTFGDAPFALAATASSGLPVSYQVISGPGTISGNTVTLTGAGTITMEATQGGNSSFNPATPVQQTVVVAKATQIITFA